MILIIMNFSDNVVASFVYLIVALTNTGFASASESPNQLAGVFQYLKQDFGSDNFYGVRFAKNLVPGYYLGGEMLFPSGSEYYLNKNGYTIKEHGGIYFSYQSSISKNIYCEVSLMGGLAMVDEVQSSGDASGICNCLNGFMEPSISILYHVTPKFSLGGMGGMIKAFSESDYIFLSGLTAVLQF